MSNTYNSRIAEKMVHIKRVSITFPKFVLKIAFRGVIRGPLHPF